jgi:hypothetical protein
MMKVLAKPPSQKHSGTSFFKSAMILLRLGILEGELLLDVY